MHRAEAARAAQQPLVLIRLATLGHSHLSAIVVTSLCVAVAPVSAAELCAQTTRARLQKQLIALLAHRRRSRCVVIHNQNVSLVAQIGC